MSLDERKKRILYAIVSLYERMGEPVGSGLLRENIDLAVSTATLRAEMAALTRLGYLAQPHTSAGRIPSTEGYRYYLDNLMEAKSSLKASVRNEIDLQLSALDHQSDRFMQGVASVLSASMNLPAFSTLPRSSDMRIAGYRLVQVGQNSVIIVAVGAEGNPHTRVVKLPKPVNDAVIERATELLNRYLCFVSKQDISISAVRDLIQLAGEGQEIIIGAVGIIENIAKVRVYYEGLQHLTYVAKNGVRLESLLSLMGDQRDFYDLLKIAESNGGVLLCEDINYGTSGLAVICETYRVGGGLAGYVGIMGPERMAYSRAVPIIRYYANRISGILTA